MDRLAGVCPHVARVRRSGLMALQESAKVGYTGLPARRKELRAFPRVRLSRCQVSPRFCLSFLSEDPEETIREREEEKTKKDQTQSEKRRKRARRRASRGFFLREIKESVEKSSLKARKSRSRLGSNFTSLHNNYDYVIQC